MKDRKSKRVEQFLSKMGIEWHDGLGYVIDLYEGRGRRCSVNFIDALEESMYKYKANRLNVTGTFYWGEGALLRFMRESGQIFKEEENYQLRTSSVIPKEFLSKIHSKILELEDSDAYKNGVSMSDLFKNELLGEEKRKPYELYSHSEITGKKNIKKMLKDMHKLQYISDEEYTGLKMLNKSGKVESIIDIPGLTKDRYEIHFKPFALSVNSNNSCQDIVLG